MNRSARAAAAAEVLILAVRNRSVRPQGIDGRRGSRDTIPVYVRVAPKLSPSLRSEIRSDEARIAMSDHVLDDEACWCGVPLECHDDLYDEIRGWHHQPDPIPPPPVTGDLRQPVAVTG
jgi:hypothetical protein